MHKFIMRNKVGLLLLIISACFIVLGVHRKEHETVAKKANMVCLECIGIG